jgi:hypothetical protein
MPHLETSQIGDGGWVRVAYRLLLGVGDTFTVLYVLTCDTDKGATVSCSRTSADLRHDAHTFQNQRF